MPLVLKLASTWRCPWPGQHLEALYLKAASLEVLVLKSTGPEAGQHLEILYLKAASPEVLVLKNILEELISVKHG